MPDGSTPEIRTSETPSEMATTWLRAARDVELANIGRAFENLGGKFNIPSFDDEPIIRDDGYLNQIEEREKFEDILGAAIPRGEQYVGASTAFVEGELKAYAWHMAAARCKLGQYRDREGLFANAQRARQSFIDEHGVDPIAAQMAVIPPPIS